MGKTWNNPIISQHKTGRDGEHLLFVNWRLAYDPLKKEEKYRCPKCNNGYLTRFHKSLSDTCKYSLECDKCCKNTSLTCQLSPFPFSEHLTGKYGDEILKVNWANEYTKLQAHEKFYCLDCVEKKGGKQLIGLILLLLLASKLYELITLLLSDYNKILLEPVSYGYYIPSSSLCKLVFRCRKCRKNHFLSVPNKAYSFRYRDDLECPNPGCKEVGINGKKGWIFDRNENRCSCRYCKVQFNPNKNSKDSWQGRILKDQIPAFDFDSDVWHFKQFYNNPPRKLQIINFQNINPLWYRKEAKQYLLYLLKSHRYEPNTINSVTSVIRKFSRIVVKSKHNSKKEITRDTISLFIDQNKKLVGNTFNQNLYRLESFLEFLDLDRSLIRSRDMKKVTHDEPDWLDQTVRDGIKQHLDKIPAPIARHYLVQNHTAARSGDICNLPFDCLVEENTKWYIDIPLQGKVDRQHRIPADRKIRKVIEQQQEWIRKTWDEGFTYLFCNFVGIQSISYPKFPSLRPLPEAPKIRSDGNPMIKMIKILIDKENILDANGQKPHFTGRITRPSRLQQVRVKHGLEAAQLLADHKSPNTTFQHYAPPTREEKGKVALPFQELLLNTENKFLAYETLPESLFKNPQAHSVDTELSPRYTVYGYCAIADSKVPCPHELYRQCYGCKSFVASTDKLPLYERQYKREQQRLVEAKEVGAELIELEAKHIIEEMDRWLPELRKMANEA